MASLANENLVIPDEKTPRVMGYLNVIFGSFLILTNLTMVAFLFIAPTLGRALDRWQSQQNASFDASHRDAIAKAKAKEAAATTEPERAEAHSGVAILEAKTPTKIPSLSIGVRSMDDPRLFACHMVDSFTGMILNIFLIASGGGLLGLREWGRRMAIVVASVALVRRTILMLVAILYIGPIQTAIMAPDLEAMKEQFRTAQAAGAPGFFFSPQWMSAQVSATAIVFAIAASIYPILVLIKLTNRRVRAACLMIAKPPREGGSW